MNLPIIAAAPFRILGTIIAIIGSLIAAFGDFVHDSLIWKGRDENRSKQ